MKKLFLFLLFLSLTTLPQSSINQHFLLFNDGNSQLQTDEVIKVVQDNTGTYWFAEGADVGNDAIYSYKNGVWVRYDVSNSPLVNVNIYDMIVTPDDRIVLATNAGLLIKNGQNWSVINTSNSNLPGNMITKVEIDKSGRFWLGVLNTGIAVGSGNPFTIFDQFNNGFPGIGDINFLAVDDSNNVFAGVDYYGLYYYDKTRWKVIIPGGTIPSDMVHVTGGMLDNRNTLWVAINKNGNKGTVASVNEGVVTYYDSTVTGKSFRSMYFSVVTDNYDNTYIGTDKGLLFRINDQWNWFDTSSVPGLPANGFWRGSVDDKNNIIYSLRDMSISSGYRGVVFYNKDSVVVTSLKGAQNPGNNGFNVSQNFPNPFNPETVIRFALPVGGYTKGVVYDVLGKEVTTLLNGDMSAGNHEIKFNAIDLSSGVYFFRLESGNFSSAIKMVVGK